MHIVIRVTETEILVGNAEDGLITRVPLENAYEGIRSGDKVELFHDGATFFMTKIGSRPTVQVINELKIEAVPPIKPLNPESVADVESQNLTGDSSSRPVEPTTPIQPTIAGSNVNAPAPKVKQSIFKKPKYPGRYLFKATIISLIIIAVCSPLGAYLTYLTTRNAYIETMYPIHIGVNTLSILIIMLFTLIVQYNFVSSAKRNMVILYTVIAILYGVSILLLYNFMWYFSYELIPSLVNKFSFSIDFSIDMGMVEVIFKNSIEKVYKKPLWFFTWLSNGTFDYLKDYPMFQKLYFLSWTSSLYLWQNIVIVWPIIPMIVKFNSRKTEA